MGSLKVREKKKFPVFTLFFLILLCAAGFMFYEGQKYTRDNQSAEDS